MGGLKHVLTGLCGALLGISASISYMEYVTKPSQGYHIDTNKDGLYDAFRTRDRRGKTTDVNFDPNTLEINHFIQYQMEQNSPRKKIPPKEPYKHVPQKRILIKPPSTFCRS